MNATVEHLGPCKKLIRVEVDPQAVDKAFAETTSLFARQAALPGFRPGKVPLHLVAKTFVSKIETEVKKRLIQDSYLNALKEHGLRPALAPEIEEIQFGRGQSLQFAATVETFPEFTLPPYKGIQVTREVGQVTEADMERALNMLREQRATYSDVSRPVQMSDYVVVNYKGTHEDKPLTELSTTLAGLSERQNFWMHIEAKDSLIPGLSEQLIGALAGETRNVRIQFPSTFPATAIAGKEAAYTVEVQSVKERVLPELNDEFARLFSAKNLDHLCAGVRDDLAKELIYRQKRQVRDQIISFLKTSVQFELPESVVASETNSVVYDIVRENQERGVSPEAIDKSKDAIYSAANASAKDRVKTGYILGRIADLEKIKAERDEILQRIHAMAEQYKMKVDKMIKQLEERGGIGEIADQIATAKVMDFLELHANVTDTIAASPPAASSQPSAPSEPSPGS